jgi:uncharacterized protein YqeY
MDNMINDKLDMLIMSAMKTHDEVRVRTLRAMKAKFTEWKTSKQNVGKKLTEDIEIQIINKMVKERIESADLYEQAHRLDIAEDEKAEAYILEEFLPIPATEEDINKAFDEVIVIDEISPEKKNMGVIIKSIKSKLPGADGKLVSQVVMKRLS